MHLHGQGGGLARQSLEEKQIPTAATLVVPRRGATFVVAQEVFGGFWNRDLLPLIAGRPVDRPLRSDGDALLAAAKPKFRTGFDAAEPYRESSQENGRKGDFATPETRCALS